MYNLLFFFLVEHIFSQVKLLKDFEIKNKVSKRSNGLSLIVTKIIISKISKELSLFDVSSESKKLKYKKVR